MTDFTATRATHAARLAHRVRREVVVQHEVRTVVAFDVVDDLLILCRTQRGRNQRLRLTAGEQRGAVGAWQNGGFSQDRSNRLGIATIDPQTGVEDAPAHDVFFQFLQRTSDHAAIELLFERFFGRGLDRINRFNAFLLDRLAVSIAQTVGGLCRHGCGTVRQLRGWFRHVNRVFGTVFSKVDDHVDHVLVAVVTKLHRTQHHVFGQLLGFGFHHHHAFRRAGNHQIEVCVSHLRNGWVENVFTILVADFRSTNRAKERQAGNGQRRRGSNHGQHITVVLKVVAEHSDDHLSLILVPVHEQWADRTVDQTAGKRLFLRWAAFALKEATGNAARSGILFLVVHGQREEIDPLLWGFGANSGRQYDGIAVTCHDSTISLARDAARLKGQRPAAPLD